MQRISGKQSKTARSLLKWNLHDLVSRVNGIQSRRIENFEKGAIPLEEWESDEVTKAFKKSGIKFGDNFSVTLEKSEADESEKRPQHSSGASARIVLGTGLSIVSDSSNADNFNSNVPNAISEEEEKEKEKEKHKNG